MNLMHIDCDGRSCLPFGMAGELREGVEMVGRGDLMAQGTVLKVKHYNRIFLTLLYRKEGFGRLIARKSI